MTFKILGFGDLHLNTRDDFNLKSLDSMLENIDTREEMYDVIFVTGDVIDNVPNDRLKKGTKEKDIALGREFFHELDNLGKKHGFSTLAQGGNHDHDIHEDITDSFETVYDATNSVFGSEELGGDPGYVFVTRGAQQFDLRPEVDYRQYEFYQQSDGKMAKDEALNTLERSLMHAGESNHDLEAVEKLEEELGIKESEHRQFQSDVMNYFDNHATVTRLFEQAKSQYGEDSTIIFGDHIAPFNTALDYKNVDGETVSHWGSISDKNAINTYEPEVAINGHQHIGDLDFVSGYEQGTTIINIDEGSVAEIRLSNGISYREF